MARVSVKNGGRSTLTELEYQSNQVISGIGSVNIWKLTERRAGNYSANTRMCDRGGQTRNPNQKELMRERRIQHWRERPFISFDGEGLKVPDGIPQPYVLFCNSEGRYVQSENGIATIALLDFVLDCKRRNPSAFLVGFGFGYDSNQIVKDLPWTALAVLHHNGKVNWKGYRIEFAPGKWFAVAKDGIYARIDDTFPHFNTSFYQTVLGYKVGTMAERERVKAGKDKRDDFGWTEIDKIREYCFTELDLHVQVMDKLRDLMDDAGYRVHNWYGPAPLAKLALRQHKSIDHLADFTKSHPDIWLNARYAYTGGRFEIFRAGYRNGPVYSYDINNAYVWALMKLPSLRNGRWERTSDVEYIKSVLRDDPYCFMQVRIRYYKAKQEMAPQPLFRRYSDLTVRWPERVENWYWGPEAALVIDDPAATFIAAWIYKDDGERPFMWVKDEYARRMELKRAGNPAEFVVKRALVSIYGCTAQRKGWQRNKGAPRYHQLEYAGYITSCCKAKIYRAAIDCDRTGDLVSIDTDAVFTTRRLESGELEDGIGEELGQWKEECFTGGLFWQNGVYWLRTDKGWKTQKSRGAPKGKVDIELAWKALRYRREISYQRTQFTTLGQALQERFSSWRSWNKVPVSLELGGSRESKRWHIKIICPACQSKKYVHGGLHILAPAIDETWLYGEKGRYASTMHSIPWAEAAKDTIQVDPAFIIEMPEFPDEKD